MTALKAAAALLTAPDELRSKSIHYDREETASRSTSRFIAAHDFSYPESSFQVAIYDGNVDSLPAASLVEKAYARVGYTCDRSKLTLRHGFGPRAIVQAAHESKILGTLTINLAGTRGLQAEALYPGEIAHFRPLGDVCEFTRLALDTALAGREVLCSLFYAAYVYAHLVHRARNLFIEVNPRHARFYERMLGFEQVGPERQCPRVSAPAVLMHLDFEFTKKQIWRSREGLTVSGTTLYRYAPPCADELRLIEQITVACP